LFYGFTAGELAQLVEHCLCKAGVRGSSPLFSTSKSKQVEVDFYLHFSLAKNSLEILFAHRGKSSKSLINGDIHRQN